ncbi:hypothetical protein [Streptacidiphilus jiangxiensis]|uniref:Uncharacterized protein n=1 Tax=Streptacidiphilus jiangxiensis TaxID=235985 RepID=A0A1H7TAX8_STRJI|nr:hypothetical protein [Streptacidiphilus jiangxiensis]SEL81446.1 hypothetical protein SAMN05414137_113150 [Streptacidiphilus jiangxiensis]
MSTAKDYGSRQIFVLGTVRQFLAELVAVTLRLSGARGSDEHRS